MSLSVQIVSESDVGSILKLDIDSTTETAGEPHIYKPITPSIVAGAQLVELLLPAHESGACL